MNNMIKSKFLNLFTKLRYLNQIESNKLFKEYTEYNNNFLENSKFFFYFFGFISLSYFIVKFVIFNFYYIDKTSVLAYLSIIEIIIITLFTAIILIFRNITRFKNQIKEQTIFLANFSFFYISLFTTVFILSYTKGTNDNGMIKDINISLLFFIILISTFLLFLIQKCVIIFLISFITFNTLAFSLILKNDKNFIGIIFLAVFQVIILIMTLQIKNYIKSIIEIGFDFYYSSLKLQQKFTSTFDGMKINYFLFKNTELIYRNKSSIDLISTIINTGNSINSSLNIPKNTLDNNLSVLDKHGEEIKLNLISYNGLEIENTQACSNIKESIKRLFKCISPDKNNKNNIGYISYDNYMLHDKISDVFKKKNLYKILKILNSINDLDSSKQFNLGEFELDYEMGKKNLEIHIIVDIETCPGTKLLEFIFYDISDLTNFHLKNIEVENKLKTHENKKMNFKRQAHEFKTPLNSIIGCCIQLKNAFNSKHTTNSPVVANNKISTLLNQLSHVSVYVQYLIKDMINIDNNPLLNIEKININDLLDFSFSILNSLLLCDEKKCKNVKPILQNKIFEDLCINSDEIRLKQIILNFISNAVKFTNQGKIILSAKNCEKNSQYIKLTVEDTGLGIKDEDKKKLFTEYGKLTNENNEFGTGLGLNITHLLAERMNIQLKVKSMEKIGTKMILYVPIHGECLTPTNSRSNLLKNDTIINGNKNGKINEKELILKSFQRYRTDLVNSNKKSQAARYTLKHLESKFRSKSLDYDNRLNLLTFNTDDIYQMKETIINPNILPFKYEKELINMLTSFRSDNEENILRRSVKEISIKKKAFKTINNIKNNFNIIKGHTNTDFINNKDKILVIDDQIFPRSFLVYGIKEILNDTNNTDIDVLEGLDGIDCLKYILDYQDLVKVIFIDENMTFMNGTETAKIIKNLTNLRTRPKIILTTSDNMETLPDNFDFYVPKPVSKNSILEILTELKGLYF